KKPTPVLRTPENAGVTRCHAKSLRPWALCYARRGPILMRTYVFGDPSMLFAEPQPEVSRVSDEPHLFRLLGERDVLIVADARALLSVGGGLSDALSSCPAAVVVV